VQLGLLVTALGFAGLFTVFTYVQPILTRITGFPEGAVSAILLVFGAGFSIGNVAGGWLADRGVSRALLVTLATLVATLLAMLPAIHAKAPAVVMVGMLGAAAFATVAPLQLRVIEKAGAAGRTLASSLNIAAFNLGNALGAWIGAVMIQHGPGLASLPLVAAIVTATGLVLALLSLRMERRAPAVTACPEGV
jgi:DHA1 family inner membrane transport protein